MKRSFAKCRQISPKISCLGVRCHEMSKTALWAKQFFDDYFRVWNDRTIIFTPSCLLRHDALKMYTMTLKGQGQNLSSGQGHVVTQVGHIAYETMRLDERNIMRPLSCIYLLWIKRYSQKKKTVGELRLPQMTFRGSPMKTVASVITEDLIQHHSEWMEMFRCGKEVVEILPIDRSWAGIILYIRLGYPAECAARG